MKKYISVGCLAFKFCVQHFSSRLHYIIRPNYVMFYADESVTLWSILGDIRDNDVTSHGGKDTLKSPAT
jgi:hypothetical protein